MRHSQLNSIVNQALSRAGIASIREPTGLVIGTSLRPDGASLIPLARGKFLAWDATCPDTVALSHLNSTRSQAGAAAMQAGALKIQKYNALAPSHSFVALAVETFGPFNQEGLEFLSELGRRITLVTSDPRETAFLFQRISAAVQQGNATSFAGTFSQMDEDDEQD